jgi:hypothetical protein
MKASEARTLTTQGQATAQKARSAAARRAAKRQEAHIREAMRKEFPTHKKQVQELIRDVAASGDHSTSYTIELSDETPDTRAAGMAVASRLTEWLRTLKYKVSYPRRDDGSDDMGDSAAPAIVYYHRLILDIDWKEVES